MTVLTIVGMAASLALIGMHVSYIRGNDTNHTGFDPWLLAFVFVPTLLLGAWTALRTDLRWVGWIACLAGCGGMVYLYYIDHFNIMVEYARWARRGWPAKR
jgi:hypothetical protein